MKTIWVVGDSTVNAGNDRASCIPRIGWGDTLARYFTDRVQVKNLAIAGTSSKSFRSTDHYPALLDGIREGDAVIISFGHNDETPGMYSRQERRERRLSSPRRLPAGQKTASMRAIGST